MPQAALAQRVDDNAVREAQDGFGFTVGDEQIGIYSIGSVRGFSPIDAGNVRLDDFYIDLRGDFPDAIEQGSAVKVGITAIRTPLLAPSGIGEIALKQIGAKPVTSLGLSFDSWGSKAVEGETRIGKKDGLSLVAGGKINFRGEDPAGEDGHGWHFGMTPRWQFAPDGHVQAYFGMSHSAGWDYGPTYYTQGAYLPERLARRRKVQQPWNRNASDSLQAGLMADIGLGGDWRARAGLFRSRAKDEPGVFEFVSDIDPAGFGLRLSARHDVGAWSGEAQLVRKVDSGDLRGELLAAVRFRRVVERSGPGQLFTLDPAPVRLADRGPVAQPARQPVARDEARIDQLQPGLSARLSWRDAIALNLGVQKADYRKQVRFAVGGSTQVDSKPVLWNAGLAVSPTARLTLYAGMAKGLEESGVAPDIAANARAALPAAITRQKDVGLSWKPNKRFNLIAGAFSIERPYANVDAAKFYRFLGALHNRGVEVSVVAKPFDNLDIVAGAMRQWPRLSGEEVAAGTIGPVPVAFAEYLANGAIDYRIPGVAGLSASASFNVVGPRSARPDDSFRLPRREMVGLGMRYRFRKGGADWALNLNVNNVLNSYDWFVSGDGGFGYTQPRSLNVSLFADF
jgi:iron complex outermembrane receptor protein